MTPMSETPFAPEPEAAPGPLAEPAPSRPRRKRPFALVVLAGLMLLRAALMLLVIAGAFLADPRTFEAIPFPDLLVDQEQALLIALLLGPFAILLIVSALGLLAFRRSGWLIAMVVTGLFVLFDIVGWFTGSQGDLWMLLNVITVFYLNQRDVRELVGDAAPAHRVAEAHA